MLEMPHHGSLRCVFKMIMGKYVYLYDFGKTCTYVHLLSLQTEVILLHRIPLYLLNNVYSPPKPTLNMAFQSYPFENAFL